MNDQRSENAPLSEKADAAFRQAAKKVILQAAQTATPVIIWEENRIQEIPEDKFKMLLTEAQLEDVK
ncbi:MAG: hypothetical protein JRJ85_28340 [Deltaproteobacteria bacterium]|nr:hypothetical protein [Deltaproteobacteria bacterium]